MTNKNKKRLKRKWPLIIFSVFLITLLASGYVLGRELWQMALLSGNPGDDETEFVQLEGFNVLLLGVDERDGEAGARTDTIILMNVDNKHNRVAMLSIPRDTRVNIPGRGTDKINNACVFGGPELTAKTVSELVGIPVKNYVVANFEGFEGVVDSLGGVTMDVERNMYHYDDIYPEHTIDLKKGVQLLDGYKALQYVRFRGDALGDISRTERQLKFLTVLGDEAMQPSTVTKLHKLVPSIYRCVDTNLPLNQMAKLALAARNLGSLEIVTQTLPGRFLDAEAGSYWQVDPAQVRQVARAFFEEGKQFDVMQGSTIVTRPQPQLTASDDRKAPVVTRPQPQLTASDDRKAPVNSGSGQAVIPPAPPAPVVEGGGQGGEETGDMNIIVEPVEPAPDDGQALFPPAPPDFGDGTT